MKINNIIAAMLTIGLTTPVVASEQTTSPQPVSTVEATEVTAQVAGAQSDKDVTKAQPDVDTADVIEEKLERYVSNVKSQLEQQGKQHKVFIYSGSADLDVDRNNPNWAKFRELTLEEAIANARTAYLKTLNADTTNNQIASMAYSKGLPTPTVEDFKTDSKMAGFVDKTIAVLEGKLDSELQEMGINPQQFASAPPAIKRDLYKQSIVDQTTRTAYGDLSGLMVIKVFEEIKESGQGTIGVAMALSASKRDQVKAMIDSKGQVAPQPKKANKKFTSLHDMFAAQKDTLYLKSGTQVAYDNNGYPMIISYGQSGVTLSKSSSKKKIERKVSKSFAENNAWANLARTYNLSGDFKNISSREKATKESEKFEMIVDSVRSSSPGLTQSLVESMQERSAMQSSIKNMTGVSIEYSWRRKHPVTGHEMVGSVLVWHPKKVTNAQNFISGKTEAELDMNLNSGTSSGKVTSAESENMFDAADF